MKKKTWSMALTCNHGATDARIVFAIPVSVYKTLADEPVPTERNGRKTLTTVQGIPAKFSRKKILAVVKKKFGECQPPPATRH